VSRPTTTPPADLRRVGGGGDRGRVRRGAVRLPRRVHRPRWQAGAAHRPQVGRRISVTPQPIWRRSSSACGTSAPTGSSMSSARHRRCTSRWSGQPRGKAGWLPDDVEVVHVQIGNVLGEDKQDPAHPRGAALRLMALLEEASKARAGSSTRRAQTFRRTCGRHTLARRDRRDQVRRSVGRARHGIRLRPRPDGRAHRQHRPLLQYAAARVRSIFRTAGLSRWGWSGRSSSPSRPSGRSRCTCSPSGRWWGRSATARTPPVVWLSL
jgi:hypothetical protein